jgi:hypothetical protein
MVLEVLRLCLISPRRDAQLDEQAAEFAGIDLDHCFVTALSTGSEGRLVGDQNGSP